MVTSQQLQPVESSERRREDSLPLLFPAAQVFQQREHWPIDITRKYPSMENEGQDMLARLFRRANRRSGEGINYFNDRMIPGTASEEIAAEFAWYEDGLINDFQRTFDDLSRYN
ncbi:hypothetical protein O181_037615 [Austropuccinia psidii MF-1]|uniref:Uncharacterized protein n=1 Tax=Austropuccinia psidii MF-1 TaxID=1389203 RepID=A0A9Q3DBA5_9BASI|nr:hypothetical protein [Austropuccinia psidii MF-1]